MKKSFAKLPRKAKRGAFAEMESEGTLYRKSCRSGIRSKSNGTVKGWGKSCAGLHDGGRKRRKRR